MTLNASLDKFVIIPDIHNKFQTAEQIIKNENPDIVVFLGDYFDDFYDTDRDAAKTAKWLVKSLQIKNRIHLVGNHDLSYMTDNPNLKCSGYAEEKHASITRESIPWHHLRMYFWLDERWLCTHAGLSNSFLKQHRTKKSDSIQQVLDISQKDLKHIDDENYSHSFFQVGSFRGGSNVVGGPLWCDYDEFIPIPGLHQIFGHSKSGFVRHGITISSFTVTVITTSFSVITWIMISWAHIGNNHERKVLNGLGLFASVLSGLLIITPLAGWVGPMAGIILGIFAGVSCYGAFTIKNKNALKDTKVIHVIIRGVIWYCVTVLPLSFWLLSSFISHM